MQFDELKNKVKEVSFNALRYDSLDNFEAVVLNDELAKLTARLEKFFGVPVFPSQQKLTLLIQQVIEEFGGIWPGQTLYFRNQGKEVIFVMLWPWQDKYRTTIKIIKTALTA